MTLKQVMLPIAMALSTIMTPVLDCSAYAGPRSLSSSQRSQWPMGFDQAAIVRGYQKTVPAQAVLVVHRHTIFGTISHQGAKGMSKCARGCLPSDSLTVRDLASSGALGRRFACERSIGGVLGCVFVGLDKLA
jgi:hypothetical protein